MHVHSAWFPPTSPRSAWFQGGPGSGGTGYGNYGEMGPIDTELNYRPTTWMTCAAARKGRGRSPWFHALLAACSCEPPLHRLARRLGLLVRGLAGPLHHQQHAGGDRLRLGPRVSPPPPPARPPRVGRSPRTPSRSSSPSSAGSRPSRRRPSTSSPSPTAAR